MNPRSKLADLADLADRALEEVLFLSLFPLLLPGAVIYQVARARKRVRRVFRLR